MPRVLHRYEIPCPGKPLPGGSEPPPDYNPERDGPWEPAVYEGPDPWDGEEPLFQSFAVVGLTTEEEVDAIKAAKGNPMLLTAVTARASLMQIDDRDVARGEFEEQRIWSRLPPKVRELVISAYNAHNVVEAATVATFRASYTRRLPAPAK